MIKQKQLFEHNPAAGSYGDCHRTCIACLLDLPPEQVPNFGEHYGDAPMFASAVEGWLSLHGLRGVDFLFQGELEDVLNCMDKMNHDVYYLLGGTSKHGWGHTVIGLNDRIEWDPSLTDSGIVSPLEGFYWITVLTPLAFTKAAP